MCSEQLDILLARERIDDTTWESTADQPSKRATNSPHLGRDAVRGGRGRDNMKQSRKFDIMLFVMLVHDINALQSTVSMSIIIDNHSPLTVDSLVDTGAIQANYYDLATADKVRAMWEAKSDSNTEGCGAKCDCVDVCLNDCQCNGTIKSRNNKIDFISNKKT
jgi:hypothetical protein